MADYAAKSAANGQSIGEVFAFQVETPVSLEASALGHDSHPRRQHHRPARLHLQRFRRVAVPHAGREITNDSSLALPARPNQRAGQGGLRRRRPDRPDPQGRQAPPRLRARPRHGRHYQARQRLDGHEDHDRGRPDALLHQGPPDDVVRAGEQRTPSRAHVILEHPYNSEYTLVDTEKPTELTALRCTDSHSRSRPRVERSPSSRSGREFGGLLSVPPACTQSCTGVRG